MWVRHDEVYEEPLLDMTHLTLGNIHQSKVPVPGTVFKSISLIGISLACLENKPTDWPLSTCRRWQKSKCVNCSNPRLLPSVLLALFIIRHFIQKCLHQMQAFMLEQSFPKCFWIK